MKIMRRNTEIQILKFYQFLSPSLIIDNFGNLKKTELIDYHSTDYLITNQILRCHQNPPHQILLPPSLMSQ